MATKEKTPAPRTESAETAPQAQSSDKEVAEFLDRVKSVGARQSGIGRGRLLFAMDATMSRQATWDMALGLQADMFQAVKAVGGLDVQLCYFRGFGECRFSKWVSDPDALAGLMTKVDCRGGYTQIGKVLSHTKRENEAAGIDALVYVGDCMEEEVDHLAAVAGELGILSVPVFLFQEGRDANAEKAFKEIARLTRGAHCRFDQGSAKQLRELLTAVAVYAAGGKQALEDLSGASGGSARKLLEQMS